VMPPQDHMTGVGVAATADARTRRAGFHPLRDIELHSTQPFRPATVKVGYGHYPPNVARRRVGSPAPIPAVRTTNRWSRTHNGRSPLLTASAGHAPIRSLPDIIPAASRGRMRRFNRRGSPRGRSCPPTSMKSHQPRHDSGRAKMGCLIGLLVSPQAALPIASLVYLPLSFAGR
jgi:hypothetical protein